MQASNGAQSLSPLVSCSNSSLNHSMAYRSVKAMVSFFEETHIDYIVHAGTLLQLYRDCDINDDANDIDFAIPLEKLTMGLKHDLVNKLGFTYLQGFGTEGQVGSEMSFEDRNSVCVSFALGKIYYVSLPIPLHFWSNYMDPSGDILSLQESGLGRTPFVKFQ